MQVSLRFKNETHQFQLPLAAKLALLMNEVNEKLSIPPEKQKIIFKGKPLQSTEELNDGMKLLLMAQTSPALTSNSSANNRLPRMNLYFTHQIIDTLRESYHVTVINMGLPQDYTKTSQYQQSVFPNSPIYIRNMDGERATLAFESDALFSVSDSGKAERIFLSDILCNSMIEIPTHPGYYALGLMTRNGNKWFYFVPNQFKDLISKTLKVY